MEEKMDATRSLEERLQAVRNKVLDAVVWDATKPTTPVLFALFMLEVLDEADFETLTEFEKTSGEAVALGWFQALLDEVGVRLEADSALEPLKANSA